MTPRTLFTILTKLFGLSVLIDALTSIPQLLGTASMVGVGYSVDPSVSIIIGIVVIAIVITLYIIVIRICLFKTDSIINRLSLDKHFKEDKFEINVDSSTILPIAIIVVGGLICVDALPALCRQTLTYVDQIRMLGKDFQNPYLGWTVFYAVKFLIGYLLISNNRKLTNWIEARQKK
jgi:hypothetical protein